MGHAFDLNLSFARTASGMPRFHIDDFFSRVETEVFRPAPAKVLIEAPLHIGGDAGVKGTVSTPDYVEEPFQYLKPSASADYLFDYQFSPSSSK